MLTVADYYPLAQTGSGPGIWPPPPRSPLPPFPGPTDDQPPPLQAGCWTHDAFETTLPFTPPNTPTLDFHRGNVCGHRVPGAPYVPGCTEQDTSLIFTWFLYEYPREWQDRILDSYQACGYTHIDFHRADWMGVVDGVPGCDKSVALELVQRCASRGLYVIVNLAIDRAPDPNEIKPWIDDLQSAGMSIGCMAWQIDQLLVYPDIPPYVQWCGDYLHQKGCKTAVQWVNGACAVWPFPEYGIENRFDFQRWSSPYIDFPYQQWNTEAPVLDTRPTAGGILGEAVDVLKSLDKQKLVACEYSYQSQFDRPFLITEDYSDLKGRSLLTATWNARYFEGGYLGGARQPNGEAL